ncbi:MAG: serpin family protein [Deltaproteobacteria bacterium]|nr:serpin family protein [Deltaproteobacteria bacterium]TLN04106.1 MAG: serpin family protein [bacterium]
MKRFVAVLPVMLLGVMFAGPGVSALAEPVSGAAERENIVQGNNAFALKMYRELGVPEGNLFFSPFSISSALGMTYAGARGDTAKEMKSVLHFSLDQSALPPAFKSLNSQLAATINKTGQKLNIANALVLTGGDVSGEFKATLKDYFAAGIFAGGLDKINGWVKQKTEGKIQTILEELDPNSVCVLLNAIYFKGAWASQFKKSSTHDASFNLAADRQVMVPMMYQKNDYKLLAEKDFQAVSLPYQGKSLSMVVLLPRTKDGLAGLEKQLSNENLTGWLAKLDRQPVQKIELFLPRFKLETSYDLVSPFTRLGMKDAFSLSKADFRGMGWPKGRLFISQIKHKAFVEVNEEGTEAAAATAVEMATKSFRQDPVYRADHPFLCLIRDNESGSILFMGRIVNPENK